MQDENPFEAAIEAEHAWSTKDIGRNSISGILTEVPTSGVTSFLTNSIGGLKSDSTPAILSVPLRRVKLSEFTPYLTSINDVIDKYQLHKALGPTSFEGIPLLNSNAYNEEDDKTLEKLQSIIPMKVPKSMDRLKRTRMLSANPQVKKIPEIFQDKSFDLKNPHTFSAIVDYKDVIGLSATNEEAIHRDLKDKLVLYKDHVEVQLLNEISLRSNSFFGALSNLQALEVETQQCIDNIQSLRKSLVDVTESNIKKSLKVTQLKQFRGNLTQLYSAVKSIGQVKDSKPIIELLIKQSDYVGALDLIEETVTVLRGQTSQQLDAQVPAKERVGTGIHIYRNKSISEHNMDLSAVNAVAHQNDNLAIIVKDLSKVMEAELVNILLSDIKAHLSDILRNPYTIQNLPTTDSKSHIKNSIKSILLEQYSINEVANTAVEANLPHPTLTAKDEELKSKIAPLVSGLLKLDRLEGALVSIKDSFFKEIKKHSETFYPTLNINTPAKTEMSPIGGKIPKNVSSPQITTPKESQTPKEIKRLYEEELSKSLKAMTFDTFFHSLIQLIIFYMRVIEQSCIINEIIVNIIKEAEQNGIVIGISSVIKLDKDQKKDVNDDDDNEVISASQPSASDLKGNSVNTYEQMRQQSNNVLISTAELTHNRTYKLIAFRADQNSKLNPKDFYRLFKVSWEFVALTEQLFGKTGFGLKGSLLTQSKSFINNFHEEKSKQLFLLLENEQWIQADIPIDFQHMTEQLQLSVPFQSNSIRTPKTSVPNLSSSRGILDNDDDDEMDLTLAARRANSSSESLDKPELAVSSKYLIVDGAKYHAVVSVLLFLKMLTDYAQCAQNISASTPDILNRIFEFLKLFNSKTCQLILGSGAMKSAGLSSITAKHISLTSQSLGLVMAVIPYVRKGISGLLNARQQVLLSDFDKIMGDYRDHQNELFMKLVNTMGERLVVHTTGLSSINWDIPEPKDFNSDGISIAIFALVSETVAFHKVVAKFLPPESLRSIMNEIFRCYVRKLEEEFKKVDLFSSAGKNRLLSDTHYFIQTLASLDGIDGPGSHLEICVNNLKIKDRRTVIPPKSTAPTAPAVDKKSTSATPAPAKSSFGWNMFRENKTDGSS